jgi:magnesium-transporting ATPase (P-type)
VYNSSKGESESIKWKDIKVGNILKVLKNEVIPADLLVIKSAADNGYSYLQTTNLDGETALKPRETPVIFQEKVAKEKDLEQLKGVVEIDPPDNNIYKVEGTIILEGYEKSHFDVNNILLRVGLFLILGWIIEECRLCLRACCLYWAGYKNYAKYSVIFY